MNSLVKSIEFDESMFVMEYVLLLLILNKLGDENGKLIY